MNFRKCAFFILGLGLAAGSARATTTYSTASSYNTAAAADVLTETTITFTNDTCSLCMSLTDSGVTFSSVAEGLNVETVSGWPDGNVLERSTGGGSISIAPTGTIYSFGLEIVTVVNGGFPIDIEYNDGSSEDMEVTTASPGSGVFFGAISTTPITSISIVSNSDDLTFAIDDVELGAQGAQSDAPEAETLFLIGSGLIALYLLRHRRKTRESTASMA